MQSALGSSSSSPSSATHIRRVLTFIPHAWRLRESVCPRAPATPAGPVTPPTFDVSRCIPQVPTVCRGRAVIYHVPYRTVLRMSECKSTNRDTVICPQYGATARACDAAVSGWPWLRSLGSLSLRLSGWPAMLGSGVEHCCSPFVSREQRWMGEAETGRALAPQDD